MRFHYMSRSIDTRTNEMQELAKKLADNGFYSILLTYHSKISDNWIKAARIASNDLNLKFMIAIRTYAISPEYCAMMSKSFNEFAENKLMLNIAAGDLHKDETSVEDVIEINNLIATSQQRVEYTRKWLDKFTSLQMIKNDMPELVMAGTSENTLLNVDTYGDYTLCMLHDRYKVLNKTKKKKHILSFQVMIGDTEEEAKEHWDRLPEGQKLWAIYGTEDSVVDQFINLENEGITDIMICNEGDYFLNRHLQVVKRITGGFNGIK